MDVKSLHFQSVACPRMRTLVLQTMDFQSIVVDLGDEDLAVVVRTLKSRSARAVNHLLVREGPVWQRGYYDHAVRRDEDLRRLARYMITNPLRTGLVEKVGDYPLWDAVWP